MGVALVVYFLPLTATSAESMVMLPAVWPITTYVMVKVVLLLLTPFIDWNERPVAVVGPASTSKPSNEGTLNESLSGSPLVSTNSTRNISPAVTISGVFISKLTSPSARATQSEKSATNVRRVCLKNPFICFGICTLQNVLEWGIIFYQVGKNEVLHPVGGAKLLFWLFLVSEICEEVVTLVINDDECGEVLNVNLTHSLHTELGEVNNLHALD